MTAVRPVIKPVSFTAAPRAALHGFSDWLTAVNAEMEERKGPPITTQKTMPSHLLPVLNRFSWFFAQNSFAKSHRDRLFKSCQHTPGVGEPHMRIWLKGFFHEPSKIIAAALTQPAQTLGRPMKRPSRQSGTFSSSCLVVFEQNPLFLNNA